MGTGWRDATSPLERLDVHPVGTPIEDRIGVDPFARALETGISKMRSPQGSAVGLNGPWGSGKSSVVNLCKDHLSDAAAADELVIVDFAKRAAPQRPRP